MSKVLVISTSLRAKSNSEFLTEQLAAGARAEASTMPGRRQETTAPRSGLTGLAHRSNNTKL